MINGGRRYGVKHAAPLTDEETQAKERLRAAEFRDETFKTAYHYVRQHFKERNGEYHDKHPGAHINVSYFIDQNARPADGFRGLPPAESVDLPGEIEKAKTAFDRIIAVIERFVDSKAQGDFAELKPLLAEFTEHLGAANPAAVSDLSKSDYRSAKELKNLRDLCADIITATQPERAPGRAVG